MNIEKKIIQELPFFESLDEKENFLITIGALFTRIISLSKACEILNLDRSSLIKILDLLGIKFSYLDTSDITIEKEW
jgi:hypothetical protein